MGLRQALCFFFNKCSVFIMKRDPFIPKISILSKTVQTDPYQTHVSISAASGSWLTACNVCVDSALLFN